MAVKDKIKSLMAMKGKKNIELAKYLDIGNQSLSNKFNRGSFSAEDLIKIADFLGVTLCFEIDDKQKIIMDSSDIREEKGVKKQDEKAEEVERYVYNEEDAIDPPFL